jgi:hypothetical protein
MQQRITSVRSPAAVVVLSLLTCHIYSLYWIFSFASEMKNIIRRDDISPGLEVLFCILCFPYVIYWSYRYGEYIKDVQAEAGVHVDNELPVLFLIMSFMCLFVVNMAIMQSKMNDLASGD